MSVCETKLQEKTSACLLCNRPSCDEAGTGITPGRVIRALRFENMTGAMKLISGKEDVYMEQADKCMAACRKGIYDNPVDIKGIIEVLKERAGGIDVTAFKDGAGTGVKTSEGESGDVCTGADLSVEFLGVKFENPFLLSSSVVGSNYEMVARAFDMGWAGVAFKTIGFFVPDEVSPRFATLKKEGNPFVGFKNLEQISDHSLEENLAFFRQLKKDYPTKIIIASIMGRTEEEWTKLAALCEEAGADMIECNFSWPQMVGEGLGCEVGINNELVETYTRAVRKGTKLPVLAKMTPNITKMEEPAKAALRGGADGIAAINTIKSIMNVNFETYATAPSVAGRSSVSGYSGKAVKPIALRFIHDLKKDPELKDVPVSGMGGIETWKDAAEFIALGCGTVQVTTAVMQYGYRIIEDMIEGLNDYMISHGIAHVSDLMGRALETIVAADDLNRSTIQFPAFNRKECVGCGRCYLACMDGGHQAIRQDEETGKPILIGKKCVGCQLCVLTCPLGAIRPGTRVDKKR